MGEFVLGSNESESQEEQSQSYKLAGIVLAVLGLLSPVLVTSYGYMQSYSFIVQSITWTFQIGTWGNGFTFYPLYYMFSMFPILILRLVPVSQIIRYYQGKTTRRRAIIGIMIGDIYFLVAGLFMLFISFLSPYFYLSIPLPIQMVVGLIILWRFPIPVPVTPWESPAEAKSWWEQDKGDIPETKDAQDKGDIPETTDDQDDKDKLW